MNRPVGDNELRRFYEEQYPRGKDIATIPQDNDFMYAQVLQQIRPYLRQGLKVLDLGCNDGNLSLYMARAGCDVVGIDLAQNTIELARRSAEFYAMSNVRFERIDFLAEWDRAECFDFILCSHVIEHIPQPVLFLRKIAFALNTTGRLVLLAPTEYSSFYRLNKLLRGRCPFDESVGHLRRYTDQSISAAMNEAGFRVSRLSHLDSPLREWFMLCGPLRRFNRIWSRRYIRDVFNGVDTILAKFLCPAAVCVHAERNEQVSSHAPA